jgi:hypothetical protein
VSEKAHINIILREGQGKLTTMGIPSSDSAYSPVVEVVCSLKSGVKLNSISSKQISFLQSKVTIRCKPHTAVPYSPPL